MVCSSKWRVFPKAAEIIRQQNSARMFMNNYASEIYQPIHACQKFAHPNQWRRKKEMLKRFGLSTLALATALAVAAPVMSMARDRDDIHGRDADRHELYVPRGRDWDHDRRGVNFGVGVNVVPTPAPAVNGYYDQYGVWHPYGYYDQWGNYHAY